RTARHPLITPGGPHTSRYDAGPREGCESGRIGTPGERVWGNSPWVRIPLPPQGVVDATTALSALAATHIPCSGRTSSRSVKGTRLLRTVRRLTQPSGSDRLSEAPPQGDESRASRRQLDRPGASEFGGRI